MPLPSNPVDRLIEKVKFNVGRANDPTLNDYVIEYLNDAQIKVQNRANFWFMHTTSQLFLSPLNNEVDLPPDFKDEDVVSLYLNGKWLPLDYVSWEDVRRDQSNNANSNGQPKMWLVEQNKLVVWPIADIGYDIRIDYWGYLTELYTPGSPENLLVKTYPEILESWATAKAFMKLREFEDANAWIRMFDAQLRELMVANIDRELPGEMVIRPRSDVYGSGLRKNRGRL